MFAHTLLQFSFGTVVFFVYSWTLVVPNSLTCRCVYVNVKLILIRNEINLLNFMKKSKMKCNNCWSFVLREGLTSYKSALDMLFYLRNETEYLPWGVVSMKLAELDGMIRHENAYLSFEVSMPVRHSWLLKSLHFTNFHVISVLSFCFIILFYCQHCKS